MKHRESKIVLWKDKEWSQIDGEPCRVIDFNPISAQVETDGKVSSIDKTTPYASIAIECEKLGENITGYVTHRMDFQHLWAAFKERTVKEDEEVIILWTKKHYKRRFLSFLMPRLWVMVCHRGAFELMTNGNTYKPELTGEARWNAQKPIVQWKPEVME